MQLKQEADAAAKDGDSKPSTAKPEAENLAPAQKKNADPAKASATNVASREAAAQPKEKPAKAKPAADGATKPSVPRVSVQHCREAFTGRDLLKRVASIRTGLDVGRLRNTCTAHARSCPISVSV